METRNGGNDGALPLLTAQEMLERCIVPVKAEFLIRKVGLASCLEERLVGMVT